MVTLSKKSLMHFEDLSLPTFQVIVVSGSMGCGRCRQRVSQVISRITGLREYTVDVQRKQVIVKGDFRNLKEKEDGKMRKEYRCSPLKLLLGSFVATCCRKDMTD